MCITTGAKLRYVCHSIYKICKCNPYQSIPIQETKHYVHFHGTKIKISDHVSHSSQMELTYENSALAIHTL